MTMATPNIQNEPGPERDPDVEEVEGVLDAHLADLRQRAEDLVASGQAEDLDAAVAMIQETLTDEEAEPGTTSGARPLTAAERRAIRGPREPKAPRLRRDLFGSAGGVK
jgi:hypothetical protein